MVTRMRWKRPFVSWKSDHTTFVRATCLKIFCENAEKLHFRATNQRG